VLNLLYSSIAWCNILVQHPGKEAPGREEGKKRGRERKKGAGRGTLTFPAFTLPPFWVRARCEERGRRGIPGKKGGRRRKREMSSLSTTQLIIINNIDLYISLSRRKEGGKGKGRSAREGKGERSWAGPPFLPSNLLPVHFPHTLTVRKTARKKKGEKKLREKKGGGGKRSCNPRWRPQPFHPVSVSPLLWACRKGGRKKVAKGKEREGGAHR